MKNNLGPLDSQDGTIELSVIVPTYNEGGHIAETLRWIESGITPWCQAFEILVVDDGSTDNTWSELQTARRGSARICALRFSRNFGKEASLRAGLEAASGRAVVVMDADRQHPVELIREMMGIWRSGQADVVEAVKASRGRESWLHKTTARLFYFMMRQLTGFDLNNASDFKLLDRTVRDAYLELKERTLFFRGMAHWVGFRRKQVSFEVAPRAAGDSKWNFRALVALAETAVISSSIFPLRAIYVLALVYLIAGGVVGGIAVVQYLGGVALTGFTTVILLIILSSASMLIALAVIGQYLGRIYREVQGRPSFLISDRLN
ncbi:MAG: glycosyltransferase family 2 protein [Pseudomonadota bacterium]